MFAQLSDPKVKKSATSILHIIMVITVCLLAGKLLLLSKPVVFMFDYSLVVVSSPSMEPVYPVNSLTVIKKDSFNTVGVGDVIAFQSDALSGNMALHRVVRITEEGFYTKGDNNLSEDNQLITQTSYVGKAIFSSCTLGRYISLVSTPIGFFLFLVLPSSVVLLLYQSTKHISTLKGNLSKNPKLL